MRQISVEPTDSAIAETADPTLDPINDDSIADTVATETLDLTSDTAISDLAPDSRPVANESARGRSSPRSKSLLK